MPPQPLVVNAHFDSGNIEVVDVSDPSSGVKLKVKDDPYTTLEEKHHKQWFSFRVSGGSPDYSLKGQTIKYEVINAGQCSYASAWPGYTVCYTYDMVNWYRCLDTKYESSSGVLSWSLAADAEAVWFSYFPPFGFDRHQELLGRCTKASGVQVKTLGLTLDGRPLDVVQMGSGKIKVWVIHRQHPGESMAEYFAEGLLDRLLGTQNGQDGLVRDLLKKCTFYIVPNMNPDGSVRGHLRTNACGANLNREWATTGSYEAPTLERSPEVFYTLQMMDSTGCDFFVDVHGDEELPYVFLSGMEGLPNWGPRLEALQGMVTRAYNRANSDMQIEKSYEPDEPGKANLAICSNQIGHRFDCMSLTLEMPFKDCKTNPDPSVGWTPGRSRTLGASLLDALAYSLPYLRSTEKFWENLPEQDKYVRPTEGGALG